MQSDIIIQKIKGVFYGQAIGDALGLGTEFLTKQQVEDYYPEGLTRYDQIIQDKHRSRWTIGSWTDDTDQFIALCDSIIECKGVDELNFASHLYKWYKGIPMGIGSTTQRVLALPGYRENPIKAAELIWRMSAMKNASNGAIMRTSIIGTFQFWDIENVIANAEKCARVTHADPRAVGSCVVVCYLIAKLIQNQNTLIDKEELIEIANNYSTEIALYINKAHFGELDSLYLYDADSLGYTLKAMACALWAYYHAKDFESGLVAIVNQGGDADTNACISGAVMGAKYGFNNIPTVYTEGLFSKAILEDKLAEYLRVY